MKTKAIMAAMLIACGVSVADAQTMVVNLANGSKMEFKTSEVTNVEFIEAENKEDNPVIDDGQFSNGQVVYWGTNVDNKFEPRLSDIEQGRSQSLGENLSLNNLGKVRCLWLAIPKGHTVTSWKAGGFEMIDKVDQRIISGYTVYRYHVAGYLTTTHFEIIVS